MGVVPLLKGAHARLVHHALPAPVLFHHVPKCGGTSVGRALRLRYLPSQVSVRPEASFRAFEAFTGRTDRDAMLADIADLRIQMLLYHLHDGVRCIAAHVPHHPAVEAAAQGHMRVTLLREPVARFLSHYAWSAGRPHAHGHIAEDFDAFLETPRAARLGALYAHYFAGPGPAEGAVRRALDTLARFDVVGRLDDMAGFARALSAALGTRLRPGHENRARGPAPGDLSAAQRARVHALTAPDRAIWAGLAP